MARNLQRPHVPRRNHSFLTGLLVVAAFTILTLLFTFPLVLHLGTHVVGRNGDVEQYIWSFWWMRKAVLELQTNPFVTRWLYFPDGVSLRFFASNPAHAFFSMALQDALGLLTAYNLMSMLTFVASAMAMYWLALDITGSRAAAFVGGIVFGFAPTHFFHFNIGQANLFAVEFIPLYVLGMRRWLGQGGIRWLFGAVAALALSSLCNWEFAVYLLLFTALYVVATFVEQRQAWRVAARTLLPRTASLGVLYLAVMSPVVVPMIQELRQPEQYMVRSRYDTIVHSADLFAVFVPNPMHPLWREWGQRLNAKFQSEGVFVTTVSISYVAAGLAVLGAIRHWQRARFWLASGLIFWVLSLGPQLQIFGRTTAIPMPYELLFQSKIIQISRAPARYIIPALLCLAILAAIGVQSLQERRAGATTRMRRLRHGSVVGLIVVALSFELLPAPALSTPPTPAPSFFVDGTLRDAGAILEVPNPSNQGMYYATLHGRPVLYGELSRDNPAPPMVDFLRHDYGRDDIIADSTGNWYCVAWYYRVTHAVIYHHLEAPEDEIATTTLHERLGPAALVRDTPEAALYRLPTPATGAPETCLVLGTGWGTARPYGDGQPLYRWTGQQASIDILRATPGRVRLHFNVHSFARPRRLQVRMGEQIVEQAQVGGSPQPVAVTLDVPAGRTRIELRSVEPALSPAQFGYTETEPIAIGVSQFRAVQEH